MPPRVSCNINFAKKFTIGRQDRKRNPAVVRSEEGNGPYEYFMQYLSVKIGEYSWGESTEYAGSSSRERAQRNIIIVRREHASKCMSMRLDLARQLGPREKRKE